MLHVENVWVTESYDEFKKRFRDIKEIDQIWNIWKLLIFDKKTWKVMILLKMDQYTPFGGRCFEVPRLKWKYESHLIGGLTEVDG